MGPLQNLFLKSLWSNSLSNELITVVGLGYIGLPTAALLAEAGYQVIGFDIDREKINRLASGAVSHKEKDVDDLVSKVVKSKNLRLTDQLMESDVFIICVPTPISENTDIPAPDLSYFDSAVSSIARLSKPGNLIIIESTCPIGTTDAVCETLANAHPNGSLIDVVYCPERVLPGNTVSELKNNQRLIGSIKKEAGVRAASIYESFCKARIHQTSPKVAEMTKLVENSFRDVNVAFANEVSMLASEYDVDYTDVIGFANMHPRVNVLSPGVGVGGHCIPVDPWFLIHENWKSTPLIQAARAVNDKKLNWVCHQIEKKLAVMDFVDGVGVITFLGAAFKPNIDDLRNSPAIEIIKYFNNKYENILVVEPNIKELPELKLVELDEGLKSADLVVKLVRHDIFEGVDKLVGSHDFVLMEF